MGSLAARLLSMRVSLIVWSRLMADRINVAELRRASVEAEWVCVDVLIALLDVAEASWDLDVLVARCDPADFDRLSLAFTRKRMALARFDFGETP